MLPTETLLTLGDVWDMCGCGCVGVWVCGCVGVWEGEGGKAYTILSRASAHGRS